MAIFNEMLGGGINAKGCDATAADILSGKTAAVGKNIVTGTMPNRTNTTTAMCGYETISVQPHPQDHSQGLVSMPNQYGVNGYIGTGSVVTGNIANLNAANIRSGVKIGQVNGNSSNCIIGTYEGIEINGITTSVPVASGQTISAGDFVQFDGVTSFTSAYTSSTSSSANKAKVVEIENNRIAIISLRDGSKSIYLSVYQISGTSVSLVTELLVYNTTNYYIYNISIAHIGNNRVCIICTPSDYQCYAISATISESTITINQTTVINTLSTTSEHRYNSICVFADNRACVSYSKLYNSGVTNQHRCFSQILEFTASNTFTVRTGTVMNYIGMDSLSRNNWIHSSIPLGNNQIAFIFDDSSDDRRICIGTVNGTSITYTGTTHVHSDAESASAVWAGNGADKFNIWIPDKRSTYNYILRRYATINSDGSITITGVASQASSGMFETSKAFHIYGDGYVAINGVSSYQGIYVSYDLGFTWNISGSYGFDAIQMKNGQIVAIARNNTSNYCLIINVSDIPKVRKSFTFKTAEAVALSSGSNGAYINISML